MKAPVAGRGDGLKSLSVVVFVRFLYHARYFILLLQSQVQKGKFC